MRVGRSFYKGSGVKTNARARRDSTIKRPQSAKESLNKKRAGGVGWKRLLAGALAENAAFASRLSLTADLGGLKPLLTLLIFLNCNILRFQSQSQNYPR